MAFKKFWGNTLLLVISVTFSLLICELAFRMIIFSKSNKFADLKDPGKYAKTVQDDYWKLYYKFNGPFKPPKNPHPLLGWIGHFDRQTLDHNEQGKLNGRRPVLFYGDSFIMCQSDSVNCFHEILNNDTSFNKKFFTLNYGVGGYGVDQIYLLFKETIDRFVNPFVVFSIMPTDMDRCLLTVRTGQKPFFIEQGDSIVLQGVPIDPDPAHFFSENSPDITSYIYRRFINSNLNPFYNTCDTDLKARKKIISLNKKIILSAFQEIKQRNLNYVFLIFDELWNPEGAWRVDSLKKIFIENNINFIQTGDLVVQDTMFGEYDYHRYCIKGDGHPTSYYNTLVCSEIRKYLSDTGYANEKIKSQKAESIFNSTEYFIKKIKEDRVWYNSIKDDALQRNLPLDSMIYENAKWMHNEEANKSKPANQH